MTDETPTRTFTDQIQATADVVRIVKERAEAAGVTASDALKRIDEEHRSLLQSANSEYKQKVTEIDDLMDILRDHVKAAAQGHEQTVKDLS